MPRQSNSWIAYYKEWLQTPEGVAEKENQKTLAKNEGRKFKITSVMPKCKASYSNYKEQQQKSAPKDSDSD